MGPNSPDIPRLSFEEKIGPFLMLGSATATGGLVGSPEARTGANLGLSHQKERAFGHHRASASYLMDVTNQGGGYVEKFSGAL